MELKARDILGSNIYENWHFKFPFEQLYIDLKLKKNVISEPRIDELSKRIKLENKNILELGCSEGGHSLILHTLGAKKIVAIEGRKENFLKCLIVKNAFNLDTCQFLFGDLNEILSLLSGPFDICLALGILYHLNNPVSIVYRIAELSNSLFIWTHYCTKNFPSGSMAEIKYKDHVYKGKYVRENTQHYLSGLNDNSFWLFEEDILRFICDAGFQDIEVIQKETHEHGPAITLLAQK